jgi:hypothetical protein
VPNLSLATVVRVTVGAFLLVDLAADSLVRASLAQQMARGWIASTVLYGGCIVVSVSRPAVGRRRRRRFRRGALAASASRLAPRPVPLTGRALTAKWPSR